MTESTCEEHRSLRESEEEACRKSVEGSGAECLEMIEAEAEPLEHGE